MAVIMKGQHERSIFMLVLVTYFSKINHLVHGMNASPDTFNVQQCVKRQSPPILNRLRGSDNHYSFAHEVCVQSTTITLKQHGNALLHWTTDLEGMCVRCSTWLVLDLLFCNSSRHIAIIKLSLTQSQ